MRDAFVRTLLREMRLNERIVLLTGDLGFGVLRPVKKEFPDRLVNCGIAEQSMVSLSAGLAATGRTVIVYSIGNFPTLRPLEQIRNDLAYHDADVKIVCVGGGFVYGSLGMSHHATEDLTMMRALPGMRCYAPGDLLEAEAVVADMLHRKGPCYLRLGRGGEPTIHPEPLKNWQAPKALTVRKGTDLAILSTGGILGEAVKAAEMLQKEKISAQVISFPSVKPLDTETIRSTARSFRDLITLEEHTIVGGFGSAVCETVAGEGLRCRVHRMGLADTFTTVVGDQNYLRHYYGMDAEAIVEKGVELIHG